MSTESGFYAKLAELQVSDEAIIRYRAQMDVLRQKKKEVRELYQAKMDAECSILDRQIAIVSSRHEIRLKQISKRFISARRRELGHKPLDLPELKVAR